MEGMKFGETEMGGQVGVKHHSSDSAALLIEELAGQARKLEEDRDKWRERALTMQKVALLWIEQTNRLAEERDELRRDFNRLAEENAAKERALSAICCDPLGFLEWNDLRRAELAREEGSGGD